MSKLSDVIQNLTVSFRELDLLMFDEDIKHELGMPSTMAQIAELERRLGFSLPPSYREFLSLHNGWNGFDGGAKLLAIEDFGSAWVTEKIHDLEVLFYEDGDNPFDKGMIPILLGEDNNNFLLLDPNALKSSGEMDFVAFDFTEEESRFPDFTSFLEAYLQSVKSIIDDEINGASD